MTNQRACVAPESRLRLVFDDAVVAFDLKHRITFGEIAELCSAATCRHEGMPVAIDVTLARPARRAAPIAVVIAAAKLARAPHRLGTIRRG